MSDADELREQQWAEQLAQACQPPTLLTSGNVLATASDRTAFVIDRAVPAGAITILRGAPGAGKSWLAYAMALAVCRGEPWLGITPAPTKAPVLVLSYDNPPNELGRRIKRLGFTPQDPIYFHAPTSPKHALRMPDAGALIRGIVQRYGVALVIDDSFRQSHNKNENDSAEMAEVMALWKEVATSNGAAILVLHHSTKANAEGLSSARGSGEILGSADAEIEAIEGGGKAKHRVVWRKVRGWRLEGDDRTIEYEIRDPERGRTTVVGNGGDRAPDPELMSAAEAAAAEAEAVGDAEALRTYLDGLGPHVKPSLKDLTEALGWGRTRVSKARILLNSTTDRE